MTKRTSTLIITRGLPASGKSTWAKAWVGIDRKTRARVNRDDLRAMTFEVPDYSYEQETAITAAARANVAALLAAGRDVVADDTNLRPKYVREWAKFARAHGAEFQVVEFPVHPDEAVERDAARANPVGEDVIRNMVKRWLRKGHLAPLPDDIFDTTDPSEAPYVPVEGARPAIIVDLDGTTALNLSGRQFYGKDLLRVGEDTPNRGVVEAVRDAHAAGKAIIFMTGRDDEFDGKVQLLCREWIDLHVGVTYELYMRAAGDKRKDTEVKRDLFDTHVRNRFDVLYVLDDRQSVVNGWRAMGLSCHQVAPGAF